MIQHKDINQKYQGAGNQVNIPRNLLDRTPVTFYNFIAADHVEYFDRDDHYEWEEYESLLQSEQPRQGIQNLNHGCVLVWNLRLHSLEQKHDLVEEDQNDWAYDLD